MKKLKLPHYPKNIWLYYAFVFLRNLSFFGGVLVPFFTDWGHISQTQVLLIQSWFLFWVFILEIPTGAVADYIGRKYSLSLGAGVIVLATLLYGSAPQLNLFLAAEFLFALGMALTSGADEALLYDTLKENHLEAKRNFFFGRAQALSLAAMLIAAPIGSYLGGVYGLNRPMQFSSLPVLIAAVIALTMHEPKSAAQTLESSRYLIIIKEGVQYLWRHLDLKIIALDSISITVIAYYVIWYYQPLLSAVGIPIAYFGWFHALLLISEIIISAQLSRLEKFFGSPLRMAQFTAGFTAFGFIMVALLPILPVIVFFIIMSGGFGLTRATYMSALMNPLIPSQRRATVLSSVSMLRRFSNMLLNPLVGWSAALAQSLTLGLLGLMALFIALKSPIKQLKLKNT